MSITPEQPPIFGIYTISAKRLNRICRNHPEIADPKRTMLYCGPVYRDGDPFIGSIYFFAPIYIDKYKASDNLQMTFQNGILADFIDFNNMIACNPEDRELYTDNPVLSELCIFEKPLIEGCAASVMARKIRYLEELDNTNDTENDHTDYTVPNEIRNNITKRFFQSVFGEIVSLYGIRRMFPCADLAPFRKKGESSDERYTRQIRSWLSDMQEIGVCFEAIWYTCQKLDMPWVMDYFKTLEEPYQTYFESWIVENMIHVMCSDKDHYCTDYRHFIKRTQKTAITEQDKTKEN